MTYNSVKAYVVGAENETSGLTSYGVVIYKNGQPVYKCASLTDQIHIARRFAEMINNSEN